MRRNVGVKIFLCISLLSLLLLWFNGYRLPLLETDSQQLLVSINTTDVPEPDTPKLKYILQWTRAQNVPFVYMGVGQKGFFDNKCEYTNCFVTSNRNYLGDYTKFDVIAFAGPEVLRMHGDLPKKRSEKQRYVFASIESSHNYPVCSNRFDGYFNWTWTYRLDSDTRWGYMIIRDKENRVVGPNKVMHWMKLEEMDPVTEEFKDSLKTKTKAAAWFVSNCHARNGREKYATKLRDELEKYNLTLDIYGSCGRLSCSRKNEKKCDDMVKTTYYFYLSFENSFSEDYVTEKLLHGLNNNAIPIVFGGANYTRFMPDGIYLNANELSAENMAAKMDELIKTPAQYAEYFRWKNHYSYHNRNEVSETNDYCGMCALLNNEEMMNKTTVYENFRDWWDSPKC